MKNYPASEDKKRKPIKKGLTHLDRRFENKVYLCKRMQKHCNLELELSDSRKG